MMMMMMTMVTWTGLTTKNRNSKQNLKTLTVPQNVFALSTGGRLASSSEPEAPSPQLRAWSVNIDVVPRVGHVCGGENAVFWSTVVVLFIPAAVEAGHAECSLDVIIIIINIITASRQMLLRNKKPNATCNYTFLIDTAIQTNLIAKLHKPLC